MNGESDSDTDSTEQRLNSNQITFGQPRCLNALSRACKDIMGEHDVGSPASGPHGESEAKLCFLPTFCSNAVVQDVVTDL